MGWGYYLVARRNHNTDHEERRELIDWHKFDELYHEISGITRYRVPNIFSEDDDGTDEVVLSKRQLTDILHELVLLPDYWADYEGETLVPGVRSTNGFGTVEKLCEIIYQYDLITEAGWEIVFYWG